MFPSCGLGSRGYRLGEGTGLIDLERFSAVGLVASETRAVVLGRIPRHRKAYCKV